MLSALVVLAERYLLDLSALTVGIIGAGNTGTRLTEKLQALGIRYYLCDPLLQAQGDERAFASLEQVLRCDVISLHVPLTTSGQYSSYHLLNQENLARLTDK